MSESRLGLELLQTTLIKGASLKIGDNGNLKSNQEAIAHWKDMTMIHGPTRQEHILLVLHIPAAAAHTSHIKADRNIRNLRTLKTTGLML